MTERVVWVRQIPSLIRPPIFGPKTRDEWRFLERSILCSRTRPSALKSASTLQKSSSSTTSPQFGISTRRRAYGQKGMIKRANRYYKAASHQKYCLSNGAYTVSYTH